MSAPSCWLPGPGAIAIAVRAQPGARRDSVLGVAEAAARPGWPSARLRVAVVAPPEDGRANAAVLRLLAAELAVKPAACRLTQGQGSRDKLITVEGDIGLLGAVVARLRALTDPVPLR